MVSVLGPCDFRSPTESYPSLLHYDVGTVPGALQKHSWLSKRAERGLRQQAVSRMMFDGVRSGSNSPPHLDLLKVSFFAVAVVDRSFPSLEHLA